ncbi:MAG TPA: PHB depolymerase family esterase [Anaerolineales bacterium]|nr:PHB depolymerase family esterase [Anaerolineales bacterium]
MMRRRTRWMISLILIYILMVACAALPAAQAQPSAAPASAALTPAIITATAEAASPELAVSTESSPSALVKSGTYLETIQSGGQAREYIIHIPTPYDGTQALPLVFVLHGFGGSDKEIARATGMIAKADQEGFFAVFPNGTGTPGGWNDIIIPQPVTTADDLSFFRDMINRFEQRLRVDPKRIYAAGLSNGGFMTYQLGAELSDQLAAIAVVEGSIGTHEAGSSLVIPQPSGPLSVVIFHGEKDTTVPYNGGVSAGQLHLNYFSVADALAFWNKNDGCTQPPVKQTLKDGNVLTEDFSGCTEGSEVLLYTVTNGVHEWPTLQDHEAYSATDAIWNFFSKHPKP